MDEKSLVQRANEERERLFQRYEHGREPGAEIDPWEDPGFEVYHQTDRYGFIHDKRLPQKIDQNEIKLRSIEMERVKKWLKMLKNWNSKDTQDKLHKRIYKGIPDKLRSKVWLKLLNIDEIMSEKKNVYQNMLKLAKQWSTEARQIDSDVNRQFREHLFYRERYSIKQKSLFNVLTAYSMYNMEVGYCQGMSGVAGVLLMYMDEEEAFWALSTLLADKKYAMHGLYIEGFPKLNRLVQHHDKIIEKFLPKLKKHFDLHNLDSMIYSLKWFFVIFIERIPFSLCLRVWDIYLLDGERVVTAMAYNILKLHQKKLLKLKDMDLLVQYLQTKLHKDFGYDDDYVIKMFEQSLEELRKSKMDYASTPPDLEFPQRPFGVFVEPTTETKIGRRKSNFTETEKEVTENVIMRREKTQQELAESTISEGLEGSNSQLNTELNMMNDNDNNEEMNWDFIRIYKVMPSRLHARDKRLWNILNHDEQYSSLPTRFLHGNIPESEDGGSLLGSSRKSLADTSITSTADLSVFSTGQRSQQFDICVDDTKSMRSDDHDAEGESSPGSAFGSLSIVGRTPSAMMITPTPRAISPHDIVRIYVPPAPPDEQARSKSRTSSNPSATSSPSNKLTAGKSTTVAGTATTSSIHHDNNKMIISNSNLEDDDTMTMMTMTSSSSNHNNFNNDNSNGSSSSKRNSIVSGEITPVRRSFIYKSDEDFTMTGSLTSAVATAAPNGDLIKAAVTAAAASAGGGGATQSSSSSSRRGSLSRKSPASSTSIIDCEHIRNKRRSTSSIDISFSATIPMTQQHHTISTTNVGGNDDYNEEDEYDGAIRKTKVMTSFEELARLRRQKQQLHQHQQRIHTTTTSDDDDFSPTKIKTKSKYNIDKCNIKYKELSQSQSSIDILFDSHHHQSSSAFQSSDELQDGDGGGINKKSNSKIMNIQTSPTTTTTTFNRNRDDMIMLRKRSDTTNSDDNEYSSSSPIQAIMQSKSSALITSLVNEKIPFAQLPLQSQLSQSSQPSSFASDGDGGVTTLVPQSSSSISSVAASESSSSSPPISPIASSSSQFTTSQSTQKLLVNSGCNSGDETTTTIISRNTGASPKSMTIINDGGNLLVMKNRNQQQHHLRHHHKKSSTNRSFSTSDDDAAVIIKSPTPPPPPARSSPGKVKTQQKQYQYHHHERIGDNAADVSGDQSYGIDEKIRKISNIRPNVVHQQRYIDDEMVNSPKDISTTITKTTYNTGNNMKLISGNNSNSSSSIYNKKINNSDNNVISSHSYSYTTSTKNSSISNSNMQQQQQHQQQHTISSHSQMRRHIDDENDDDDDNEIGEVIKTSEKIGVTSPITPTNTNIDFDRRIAAPLGGPYDYKNHHHHSHHHHHHHHNTTAKDMNKIRIKVQQNQ